MAGLEKYFICGAFTTKGNFSKVTYTLNPLVDGRRTQLSLVQTGVPEDKFDDINHGWRKFYWTKMADCFRDETAALVRRFIEGFKKKANLDTVDERFMPDFGSTSTLLSGPEGLSSCRIIRE